MSEYLSPQQAVEHYKLELEQSVHESEIEKALRENGIAAIEIPLSPDDFARFSNAFDIVLNECPTELKDTFYKGDERYGSEVGYTRKELKMDTNGVQVADPKNYFHFTENARSHWKDKFRTGPKVLQNFLNDGFEIHDALIGVAKSTVRSLENTHPNISKLYFPNDDSFTFLRLLRYDGYTPHENMLDVATPHFDIAGVTLQAYADAPGFWAAPSDENGQRTHHNTRPNEAYAFVGEGHRKVYGENNALQPLYHGVDRIIPAGVTWVPERTAVILFVDAPEVDYEITMKDTRPYTTRRLASFAIK
ncbi:MAG: hypothetical protein ABIR46_02340 [Candidatus Saccharimonadales bacterium]